MKIVFVIPRFHPNMNSHINSIIELNHEVSMIVAYTDVNEDHSKVSPAIVSLFKQNGSPSKIPIINPLKLFKLLKSYNADLIIFRADRNRFTVSALLGLYLFRKKIIVYDQYKISDNNRWIKIFLKFRDLILKPKIVVTPIWDCKINQAISANLIQENLFDYKNRINHQLNTKNKNRFWWPFSIEKESFESVNSWINRPIDILISSKLVGRKNIIEFIQQLKKVSSECTSRLNVTLALIKRNNEIDDIYLKAMNKEMASMPENINLDIYFNIPPIDMPKYFLRSKVFVMISDMEPASYSNIQAAAAGCFVFLSKENGSIYQHPFNTLATNFSEIHTIAQDMVQKFNDVANVKTEIEEFRAQFLDLFDSRKSSQRLLDLIK